MKKKLLLLHLFLSVQFLAVSQVTPHDYIPLQSVGPIPPDFIIPSSAKYEVKKSEIAKEEPRRSRKAKEQFYLSSSFEIDKLLLSGQVCFNDPVSKYVNKVLAQVLKPEPELQGKLRVYVVKSASVNAFSTDQGIIFVNLGLLAQLENEAQLAMVLSHEVTHYVKKHSLDLFEMAQTISRKGGSYKNVSSNERLVAKNNYSKELETEADEQGLERYLKSNYSLDAINGVFDVLQYSYLPFDELPFDKQFFETSDLVFPKKYFLKEVKAVGANEEVDDDEAKKQEEMSTHPSIPDRRKNIMDRIAGKDNTGRVKFIVSEEDFKKERDVCRFEVSRIYLLNHEYEAGIYNSYLLLKQYPDNLYLKKNIAKCLMGLTLYDNSGNFGDVHVNYKKVEGESQQVNYLIDNLTDHKQELNIVALNYAWRLKQTAPDDEEIKAMCKTLFNGLVDKLDYGQDHFYTKPHAKVIDSISAEIKKEEVEEDQPEKIVTKYDRIKRKKLKASVSEKKDEEYYKYAFVELFKDPEFKQMFEDEEVNARKKRSVTDKLNVEALDRARRRYIERKGFALGINRIAIVDPFYAKIDLRKNGGYKYLESEKGQISLKEKIVKAANANKLQYAVVDMEGLQSSDVATFNDLALLNEWIVEQLGQNDEVHFSGMEKDRIKSLEDKYNTRYFLWTGAISTKEYAPRQIGLITLTAILPVFFPYLMSEMFSMRNFTYYYSLLYDVETNRIMMSEYYPIFEKDHSSILNSYLYSTFNQITYKRK